MLAELRTPRLRLGALTAADAAAVFAYRSDPEVARYQSFEPGSLADVERFLARDPAVGFDTPGEWYQLAIRLRDTGELIGDLGTHVLADDPQQAEIGFTVAPAHQGKGYATEAVQAVLDEFFGPRKKHRVFAGVDPRNAASIALLRRVGMRQEARHVQSLWLKGEWVDDMIFAMLSSEWRALGPRKSGVEATH